MDSCITYLNIENFKYRIGRTQKDKFTITNDDRSKFDNSEFDGNKVDDNELGDNKIAEEKNH